MATRGYRAGANPTNRLTFFSTAVSEGINHVDGAGDRGGWGSPSFPAGQPLDGTTTQGGISVITPTTITGYDPTQSTVPMRAFAGGGGGGPTTSGAVEYRPPAYDESQIKGGCN